MAIEYYKSLADNERMVTGLVTGPLGFAFVADDRADEGIQYFAQLVKKHEDAASARIALAVLLRHDKQTVAARKQLLKVILNDYGSSMEKSYVRTLLAKWKSEDAKEVSR